MIFTTYRTWLHGDERGSYDTAGYVLPDEKLNARRSEYRSQDQFVLTFKMRKVVHEAIEGVCEYRGWKLHALNVRTNHVHVVAGGVKEVSTMYRDFKSYATRALRKANLVEIDQKVWTRSAGHKFIQDYDVLDEMIRYVKFRQ